MPAKRALDRDLMLEALAKLDAVVLRSAHLVIGGGAAMVLAYDHRLGTQDVDAFAAKGGLRVRDLDSLSKRVAIELNIEPDWLNAHFETFTGVLPDDYATRLRVVFEGTLLRVDALGPEDLLIMKCFAARDKDRPHARRLVHIAEELSVVDRHLSTLVQRRYPKAKRAADYFDDLRDEEDV